MGGCSYDRDVYSSSSSSGWGSSGGYGGSAYATSKLGATTLASDMWANKRIRSSAKQPVVIALDVTGSNTSFAKIVYDKMPMLYGQIEQKKYLEDFDICFMAIGDTYSDDYPLQVGEFAKGIELDSWLEKVVLEGGGGGNNGESYELGAYYLLKYMDMPDGAKPIIFFLGDEQTHGNVTVANAQRAHMECPEEMSSETVWKELRKKANDNVFMMLNKYCGTSYDTEITRHWENLLADEHVIKVGEPQAIVDLILGVISMVSQQRNLDTYMIDMKDRGQTQARISGVSSSLEKLSTALVPVSTNGTIATTAEKKTTSRGKRI